MAPIHFGTLVYEWQAIDVLGPFDLINSATKEILAFFNDHSAVAKETIDRAPEEIVFHYIGEDMKPKRLLTSNVHITPTCTIENCPPLDHLLVGGPIPNGFKFPPSYVEFIKKHNAAGKTIFTTCTGASALASTGVLDGKNATVNHIEYNWITQEFPKVKWTNKKKWIIDGNIWTAAGAVAGMDMFAHWLEINYGKDVMIAAALGLDFEPRDVDGLFTVLPKRYDASGKQISSHVFP